VGGASGIAVYLIDHITFVADVGNALAVVSRAKHATPVSKQHDPWDRDEATRIRSAEGWILPAGLTNGRSTCHARSGTTSSRGKACPLTATGTRVTASKRPSARLRLVKRSYDWI
jgi:hypothetical protein